MSFKKPFRAVPIQMGRHYRAKRRRQKAKRLAVPALVLGAAAIVGGIGGALPSSALTVLQPGYDSGVEGCTVTDGDTVRCNGERIRLLGIDAPELPGCDDWDDPHKPGWRGSLWAYVGDPVR